MGIACRLLLLVIVSGCCRALPAAELHVAAASNFSPVLEALIPDFAARTGHRVIVSYGASGTLYAQIRNGAPFAVLLSADAQRPQRLEAEGLAVPGSRFTYALGRLVLWSPSPQRVDAAGKVLAGGEYRFLAIANPDTAPYGAAARAVLEALGLWPAVQGRLVQGENIGQTFQFVASGNAELGFVALSQTIGHGGSRWVVPPDLYPPIGQQAVLLTAGRDNPAARAFLDFLQSETARQQIAGAGYGLP